MTENITQAFENQRVLRIQGQSSQESLAGLPQASQIQVALAQDDVTADIAGVEVDSFAEQLDGILHVSAETHLIGQPGKHPGPLVGLEFHMQPGHLGVRRALHGHPLAKEKQPAPQTFYTIAQLRGDVKKESWKK
ncbi:MAG: hypothetical protein AMJ92_13030 [candidate division Zixibacteria bacterium SM23_81]|nr:MAG: hypothetical protein AMJ92_13030 [candidate division Zixibacteria bacterium SM23_81]